MQPGSLVSRLCLIIVVVVTSAIAGVNMLQLRKTITGLQADVRASHLAQQETERQLTQTKSTLANTLSTLKETKASLEASNTEREQALATAAAEAKRSEDMAKTLKHARQERDEAKTEWDRYRNTGLNAEQVAVAAKTIADLRASSEAFQAENVVLSRELRLVKAKVNTESPVPLPPTLQASVKVADPKWHFVILDAGSDKGMLERGELLISREGKLVAKVNVTRVDKDRSIANLSPEWNLAEIKEGDLAVPATPGS